MRFRASITTWLLLLVLLPTLPLLAFSLYSAYRYAGERRTAVENDLIQSTDLLSVGIRDRLARTLGTMSGLASSDAAQRGDLAALYEDARRIQARDADIAAISLIAPDNRMLFLTLRPLGDAIPASDLAAVREVFATGKPALSAPFLTPFSTDPVVALGVPVIRAGHVVYCLRGIISSRTLNALLQSDDHPDSWLATLVDGNGILVARSRDPERWLGQKATPQLVEALSSRPSGVWDGVTKEGIQTRTAIRPVGDWGWHIALGVATSELLAPLHHELRRFALLGIALVALCTGGVLYLSRRVSRALRQTVAATQKVIEGAAPQPQASGIAEIDRMHEALTHMDAYGRVMEQQVAARTRELLEAKERIARFAVELDESIETERQRISREVHDQIGAVLTGIKMIFRSLPPAQLSQADEKALIDALDAGVATARRIASELRPPLIDDIGLQAAVEHLLDSSLRPSNLLYSVKLVDWEQLTAKQALGMFRIIQEASTNVVRHAQAAYFSVDGRVKNGEYEVTMSDNGIGFPAAPPTQHGLGLGLGMVGMRERAELMGGRLSWTSRPQQGTRLTLHLPIRLTQNA